MKRACCLIICTLLSVVAWCDEVYTIEGNVQHPTSTTGMDTKILLTGTSGTYLGIPSISGDFKVQNVPSGSYLLEVFSTKYVYDLIRLDIKTGKVRARVANDTTVALSYPLNIKPIGKAVYFVDRQPYNFSSILKNPMMIMVGITMLLTFVMPKMMANMDPEALKELQGGTGSATPPAVIQTVPTWRPPLLTN